MDNFALRHRLPTLTTMATRNGPAPIYREEPSHVATYCCRPPNEISSYKDNIRYDIFGKTCLEALSVAPNKTRTGGSFTRDAGSKRPALTLPPQPPTHTIVRRTPKTQAPKHKPPTGKPSTKCTINTRRVTSVPGAGLVSLAPHVGHAIPRSRREVSTLRRAQSQLKTGSALRRKRIVELSREKEGKAPPAVPKPRHSARKGHRLRLVRETGPTTAASVTRIPSAKP